MGTRQLSDYQEELRDALQRPSLVTVKMNRWINASLKEFGYAFPFRELEKTGTILTVDGTRAYNLATDFRMLRDSGFRKTAPPERLGKLKKETREQYQRRVGDTADTTNRSNPEWYHRYGSSIYLRPVPDSTVTTVEYDYWAKITDLVGASDVSPFSDDWDDIVFVGALYRGFRAQGEHDRYINIRNDFISLVRSRALDEDLEEFAQGGLNIISDSADQVTDTDA